MSHKFCTLFVCALFAVVPVLAAENVTPVSSATAHETIAREAKNANFVVLDIRTPDEFKSGHLPRAINVDFKAPDFEQQLAKLDRAKTYVVYCRTGNRSTKSLALFEKLGFKHVLHLEKGITEWVEKGYAVE